MGPRLTLTLAVALGGTAVTAEARVLDGERQGFIVGGGAGYGFTRFSNRGSDNEGAIGTDFRIGYAPNDQMMLYWSNRVAWIPDGITLTHSTTGFGTTYYTSAQSPAPFVAGAIGLGSLAAPFESSVDSETSFGVAIGGGYEFAPHWNVESSLTWASVGERPFDLELLSVVFLITLVGY